MHKTETVPGLINLAPGRRLQEPFGALFYLGGISLGRKPYTNSQLTCRWNRYLKELQAFCEANGLENNKAARKAFEQTIKLRQPDPLTVANSVRRDYPLSVEKYRALPGNKDKPGVSPMSIQRFVETNTIHTDESKKAIAEMDAVIAGCEECKACD